MRTVIFWVVLACVSSSVACGDDDGGSGAGGASATGGSSGSGGVGGDNDAGGSGGSGGSGGFPSITCGTLTCAPTLIAPACCTAPGTGEPGDPLEFAGRAPNQCGTDLGQFADAAAGICLQLRQPGTIDEACPALPGATAGQTLPGCCTNEGFCGGYEGFLPLGCTYPATGRGHACGANVDGGTADAGH